MIKFADKKNTNRIKLKKITYKKKRESTSIVEKVCTKPICWPNSLILKVSLGDQLVGAYKLGRCPMPRLKSA